MDDPSNPSPKDTGPPASVRAEGMPPLRLVLVFHDTMPPGRGHSVMALHVDRVVRPLFESLERFPKVRVALHLCGPTLVWLREWASDALDLLRKLVARGQVELLAGPFYGAVLQLIPERDALEQLRLHRAWVEEHLRFRTRGAWLPGLAWDPTLPRLLARSGLRYVFVDQGMISAVGAGTTARQGWFISERMGAAVGVLPVERRLSLVGPTASPELVQAQLERHAQSGRGLVGVALPLHRFGGSDGSHELTWDPEDGWMERFLDMLERESSWLRTRHAWHVTERDPASERVYLPAATPPALGAALLPVEQGRALLRRSAAGACDGMGPPFEAALVRHDAANRLHKRMLRVSAMVQLLRRRALHFRDDQELQWAMERATAALYAAQCGAVLHQGPGGFLDDGEVRQAAWTRLLEAEEIVLDSQGRRDRLLHEVVDYDCDGRKEVLITTPAFQAVVCPSAGGGLVELGVWNVGNVLNTIQRGAQVWHDDIALPATLPTLVGPDDQAQIEVELPAAPASESGDLGEREFVLPLEPDLGRLLVSDRRRRLCFQEHFVGEGTTLDNLRLGQHPQLGDFLDARYRLTSVEQWEDGQLVVGLDREGTLRHGDKVSLVRISKRYRFHPRLPVLQVGYLVGNRHGEPVGSQFAVELNLNLDSGQTGERYLRIPGFRPVALDEAGGVRQVSRVGYVMGDRGIELQVLLQRSAHIYHYPVDTPVHAGDGCVSGHQGTCLVIVWNADLWGGERARFDIQLRVVKLKQ